MKNINDLHHELLLPIASREDAERFLRRLCAEGLDHHADDDPVDCLHDRGGPLSEIAAKFIGWQLRDAAAHVDCIHDAMMRAHVATHGALSVFYDAVQEDRS